MANTGKRKGPLITGSLRNLFVRAELVSLIVLSQPYETGSISSYVKSNFEAMNSCNALLPCT